MKHMCTRRISSRGIIPLLLITLITVSSGIVQPVEEAPRYESCVSDARKDGKVGEDGPQGFPFEHEKLAVSNVIEKKTALEVQQAKDCKVMETKRPPNLVRRGKPYVQRESASLAEILAKNRHA